MNAEFKVVKGLWGAVFKFSDLKIPINKIKERSPWQALGCTWGWGVAQGGNPVEAH